MINKIVDDINRALDNECLLSALALALTIPDVCGKAEWPEKRNGRRYIDWFDTYVGVSERCTCEECQKAQMPYLSGEVVYSLRNCFLHQGTLDIEPIKVKAHDNHIDEFVLVTERKKEYETCALSYSVMTECDRNGNKIVKKRIRVSVRHLCFVLTACAKGYYEKNKDKFDFIRFSIMDWDAEMKKE
ncbi:MAG: hypothetical protein E7335_05975 [Clostridiales bacterium]|nr:hypothetical protein [Clostridiales bacterium]